MQNCPAVRDAVTPATSAADSFVNPVPAERTKKSNGIPLPRDTVGCTFFPVFDTLGRVEIRYGITTDGMSGGWWFARGCERGGVHDGTRSCSRQDPRGQSQVDGFTIHPISGVITSEPSGPGRSVLLAVSRTETAL